MTESVVWKTPVHQPVIFTLNFLLLHKGVVVARVDRKQQLSQVALLMIEIFSYEFKKLIILMETNYFDSVKSETC